MKRNPLTTTYVEYQFYISRYMQYYKPFGFAGGHKPPTL